MSDTEDSADSHRLGTAITAARAERLQAKPKHVCRRLMRAASILETQGTRATVGLLCDSEALGSEAKAPDKNVVPEFIVEVFLQIITIVALCALALSAGIIVGSVMSRTTLTTSSIIVRVSRFGNEPFLRLFVPNPPGEVPGSNTTAVLMGQFTATISLRNKGAYIEALGLLLDFLYIPAPDLPAAGGCFSPTGIFSDAVSIIPSISSPASEASTALINRGREAYSLIRVLTVETNRPADVIDRDVEIPAVQVVRFYKDKRWENLFTYDIGKAPVQFPSGPTILVSNSVPFIAGLRVGVDNIQLYFGVNVPLERSDAALLRDMHSDCAKGRMFLQLRTPALAATSMFFKQMHDPFAFSVIQIPCEIENVNLDVWPPQTPHTFYEQFAEHSFEMSTLAKEEGQKG